MADVIIISVFDVYLIGIATILLLITAIRYFGLAKRKENPNEKSIVNAYAWMFVFLTITSILLTLSFFYLEGVFIGLIYRGNFDNPPLIYVWLTKCSYICFFAAFIFYFYTYEKILNKRIHLGPFAMILIIILIIFLPYELAMYQFFPIALAIIGLYLMHTFFALMKWSQRELRAATSFIILGTLFMSLFLTYMNPGVMRLGDTPILIFPAFLIFGTLLCMSPTVFKPEFFSRNIRYWYLFIIIFIVEGATNLIYYVTFTNAIDYFILYIAFLTYYVVECVFLIRFIKREELLGVEGDTGVRGIFTKPEKITEEEVSISKEKKICLVCKGKILGFNSFICKCDVLYCERCARSLSNLENACWVCGIPFDKSKPVKPYKREEEKVIGEEITRKKKKQSTLKYRKNLKKIVKRRKRKRVY